MSRRRRQTPEGGGAAVADERAAASVDRVANSGELTGGDGAAKWTPEEARAVFARASELLATMPPSEHAVRLAVTSWSNEVAAARREAQRPRADVRDSATGKVVERGRDPHELFQERLSVLERERPTFNVMARRAWVLAALAVSRECAEIVRANAAELAELRRLDDLGRLDQARGERFDELRQQAEDWHGWSAPGPDSPLGGLPGELAQLVPAGIATIRDRVVDRLARLRPALPFARDALQPLIEADERALVALGEVTRNGEWQILVDLCERHGVNTDAPAGPDIPDIPTVLAAAAAPTTERNPRR